MNTSSGNLLVGYVATPGTNTYKLNVNGDVYNYGKKLVQSNISGGNTVFFDVQNYSGTSLFSITTGSIATITASATFTNNITFAGKLATANSSGLSIVGGSFPASLSQSQLMFLISAPLNNYTSTYGLNEQGIFLGGTYNGGQGPTRLVLGPSLYYNTGSIATGVWDFTITPASGQITDGYGSSLILAGGRGRGTGTPGKFVVQTSTATTTGTTLQTLSNRLEIDGTGQLKLNGYTSTSVFTGTVAGLLGFDSSGNIITTSASGGGISGSGTAGQVTYWSGTSAVTGSSNLFWDNTKKLLSIGSLSSNIWSNYSSSLQIGQLIINDYSPTPQCVIQSNLYYNGTNSLTIRTGGTGIFEFANNGDINIWNGISQTAGQISTATIKLKLFSSTGNVTIQNGGTFTDSGYRLDINGTGATNGALRVTGGGSYFNGTLDIIGASSYLKLTYNGSNNSYITAANDGAISFKINSNIKFYVGASSISGVEIPNTYSIAFVNPGVSINSNINWNTTTNTFEFKDGTKSNFVKISSSDISCAGTLTVTTNKTTLAASTTSYASLNIPSGTAPTSPANGDIWYDGTNIYIRVGGSTKTFTII